MKKSLLGLCLAAAVVGTTLMPAVVDAATGGGEKTTVMTVVTKADWSKLGQESITIGTGQQWCNKSIYGVFKVYLDGKYKGYLGDVNKEGSVFKQCTQATIKLDRNRTHKIQVVYDKTKTQDVYQKLHNESMAERKTSFHWYVARTCKVSNYY